MRFTLFKRIHNKTFTHIPIYYDEREERIKELEEEAKGEMSKKSSDYHNTMKGSMRRFQHNHPSTNNFVRHEKKRSNVRIIVILSILFLLAYLLWNYTDTFVEAFVKH